MKIDGRKLYTDTLSVDQLKERTAKAREISMAKQIKTFEVISPNGNSSIIKNLKEFCLANDLDDSAMNRVARGTANHHKGWKCKRVENGEVINIDESILPETRKRNWIITTPDGEDIQVSNLKQFCEDRNLSYFSMKEIAYGRREPLNGWKVRQ